ncbi:MAG: pyridoxamine 5'-phosphate oxidase [Alphaproteobacteria bacterium]|nr:pyridoxamine 5'-phosphate oxidase [Alphaproteobacteria bacterium]
MPPETTPLTPADDPFALFSEWLAEADAGEPGLPHAMSLATVAASGTPSLRMVLLKGADERGFVFYTNSGSRKVDEIEETGAAALCFHWKSVRRQVRIEGRVERVGDAEADAYWAGRPRDAQIGAWASRQSQPYAARAELEAEVAACERRFAGRPVPRPEFWTGYRVVPARIEFWREQPSRLHDRLVYTRAAQGWTTQWLNP